MCSRNVTNLPSWHCLSAHGSGSSTSSGQRSTVPPESCAGPWRNNTNVDQLGRVFYHTTWLPAGSCTRAPTCLCPVIATSAHRRDERISWQPDVTLNARLSSSMPSAPPSQTINSHHVARHHPRSPRPSPSPTHLQPGPGLTDRPTSDDPRTVNTLGRNPSPFNPHSHTPLPPIALRRHSVGASQTTCINNEFIESNTQGTPLFLGRGPIKRPSLVAFSIARSPSNHTRAVPSVPTATAN